MGTHWKYLDEALLMGTTTYIFIEKKKQTKKKHYNSVEKSALNLEEWVTDYTVESQ